MKPAPLQITHQKVQPDAAVIVLAGKVMLGAGTAEIEELITSLLAKGDRRIVVDLSGVTHIDSTGIGTFIASLSKVMQAGGALAMVGASGVVREGFRVTRLDSVFRFFPDVASALSGLGQPT
ncbi:MAG: STAS domain-containing protein [Acidobacteriota bacterium]